MIAKHHRGFTLLEVMVALLILLVGLLGIAALLVRGQHASYEAYQRQQALAIAQELVEKIRSNQGGAPYYVTGTADGSNMPGKGNLLSNINDCSAGCDASGIAQHHLAQWDGILFGAAESKDNGGTRLGGINKARGCIEWPSNETNQPQFLVSVSWQGDTETTAPPNGSSDCGKDLYGTESRRRLITLRVATCRLNQISAGVWQCSL